MFQELLRLFSGDAAHDTRVPEDDLRLAATALLVQAAYIDGQFSETEETRLRSVLQGRFALADDDVDKLIRAGAKAESEAVDLYGFTRVLTAQLDQPGRKDIVAMLWAVVLADGKVTDFESNLVARVCELLGVSSRDRVILRKLVESGAWQPRPMTAGELRDNTS